MSISCTSGIVCHCFLLLLNLLNFLWFRQYHFPYWRWSDSQTLKMEPWDWGFFVTHHHLSKTKFLTIKPLSWLVFWIIIIAFFFHCWHWGCRHWYNSIRLGHGCYSVSLANYLSYLKKRFEQSACCFEWRPSSFFLVLRPLQMEVLHLLYQKLAFYTWITRRITYVHRTMHTHTL